MRRESIALLVLCLITPNAQSQGTLQYDQQSATMPVGPDLTIDIQSYEPVGQSFVPSLTSVGFVQLELFDGQPNNGVGATLYVNLRSDSITGPIVSSTSPVFMPDTPLGGGVTNFFFSTPAIVTPGTTYFFEVVVQSGDMWRVNDIGNSYHSGRAYISGIAQQFDSLWFREGIVVPEPTSTLLLLLAAFCWFIYRRLRVLVAHV